MAKKDAAAVTEPVVEAPVADVAPVVAADAVAPEVAAEVPAPVAVEAPPPRLNIQDACGRISNGDARLFLLLYAFQREEEQAGRTVDTIANYRARFDLMRSRPATR